MGYLSLALDILAVDPRHHFRGAGRMLVEWGMKKADEMDVQVSQDILPLGLTDSPVFL